MIYIHYTVYYICKAYFSTCFKFVPLKTITLTPILWTTILLLFFIGLTFLGKTYDTLKYMSSSELFHLA